MPGTRAQALKTAASRKAAVTLGASDTDDLYFKEGEAAEQLLAALVGAPSLRKLPTVPPKGGPLNLHSRGVLRIVHKRHFEVGFWDVLARETFDLSVPPCMTHLGRCDA